MALVGISLGTYMQWKQERAAGEVGWSVPHEEGALPWPCINNVYVPAIAHVRVRCAYCRAYSNPLTGALVAPTDAPSPAHAARYLAEAKTQRLIRLANRATR